MHRLGHDRFALAGHDRGSYGHHMAEEVPEALAEALADFFSSVAPPLR
jgi:hypothetical protein